MALVLISLVMYAAEDLKVKSWSQMTPDGVWNLVGMLLKANLWEVLAIIGIVQILLLPLITASTRVRTIAWILCCAVKLGLAQSFDFFFVHGKPNWMDDLWGFTGEGAWDGGCFGVLGWAVPMWRELAKMSYLWRVPHALDGGSLSRAVGSVPATPLAVAAKATLMRDSEPVSV